MSFSNAEERVKSNRYFDISTNFLIKNDLENWKEELVEGFIDQVEVHRAENVRRQINFISRFPEDNLGFDYPKFITIGHSNVNKDGDIRSEDIIEVYRRSINKILDNESMGRGDNTKKRLVIKVLSNMLNNVFNEFPVQISIDATLPPESEQQVEYDIKIYLLIIHLKETLEDYLEHVRPKKVREEFSEILYSFIRKIDAVANLIAMLLREEIEEQYNSLIISVSHNKLINQFISLYMGSFSERAYMTFNWGRNMSSGQKAMLDLYSRFFYVAEQIKEKENRHIIVIIDEVDLYFHPQWQKKIIKDIIEFLSKILPENSIQIILSSNSPFIISDLPRSNVVLVKNEKNHLVVANGLEKREQTFAANIHTLFSDSFFLKESLIGDFAMKKINWIIGILHSNERIIKINEQKVRKIINVIGEPIIKAKLKSMLDERLFSKNSEIKRLKERIKYLESLTKDTTSHDKD